MAIRKPDPDHETASPTMKAVALAVDEIQTLTRLIEGAREKVRTLTLEAESAVRALNDAEDKLPTLYAASERAAVEGLKTINAYRDTVHRVFGEAADRSMEVLRTGGDAVRDAVSTFLRSRNESVDRAGGACRVALLKEADALADRVMDEYRAKAEAVHSIIVSTLKKSESQVHHAMKTSKNASDAHRKACEEVCNLSRKVNDANRARIDAEIDCRALEESRGRTVVEKHKALAAMPPRKKALFLANTDQSIKTKAALAKAVGVDRTSITRWPEVNQAMSGKRRK